MLRIVEDTDVVIQAYNVGAKITATRKRFECPHCHGEVAYYVYSPFTCPICKGSFADLDKLTRSAPYGRIAYFQGQYV
jgi:Zn finger protein HypA/HybF involved in hydrogenase expression